MKAQGNSINPIADDHEAVDWLENDAMDNVSDKHTYSCSDESDHEEYWDIDAAELDRDFNLVQDEQNSINGSTTRLIRIIALFLLLWASFYS